MSPSLPYLGVGLSYRWALNPEIVRNAAEIDWLEITPEHFLPLGPDGEARLSLLARRFPLVGHSLELSVGSDGDDPPGYRESIRRVLELTRAPWHGDHLCFTRLGPLPVRALSPLPWNEGAIEVAVRNIRRLQAELGRPFAVENITYHLRSGASTMDEAAFLRAVVERADCALLLDLHNVFTNSVNYRFDPIRFLDALPLDRVVQIHLAGGVEFEGIRFDSHTDCAPREVWDLLDYVASRCPLKGVNFEMDGNFPPFPRLLEELAHARTILARHGLARA